VKYEQDENYFLVHDDDDGGVTSHTDKHQKRVANVPPLTWNVEVSSFSTLTSGMSRSLMYDPRRWLARDDCVVLPSTSRTDPGRWASLQKWYEVSTLYSRLADGSNSGNRRSWITWSGARRFYPLELIKWGIDSFPCSSKSRSRNSLWCQKLLL